MNYVTLTCNHQWYYRSIPPTDLVFCWRCQDYFSPNLDKPHKHDSEEYAAPKPPAVRRGGAAHMKPEVKTKALKQTYELADEGHSAKYIASVIGVTEGTIKNWLTNRGTTGTV